MLGTLIDAGAVITGSAVGLILHAKLPKKVITITFQAIGLFTLLLGVTMALKTSSFLIMIFSLAIGSIVGELIETENHLNQLGDYLKRKIKSKNDKFSEGLITAFLLFGIGPMATLGPIEEGLGKPPNLLLAKSILDGLSSIALAAALGVGVIFSAIPLLVCQGSITLLANYLQDFLTQGVVNELTAVGGVLLIGLAINILEIKKLKILNMLPSLIVAVVLAYLFL